MNRRLLEDLRLLRIEVESHLTEPFKRFGVDNVRLDQVSRPRSLVNEFVDQVFQFSAAQGWLFLQNGISQDSQRRMHLSQNSAHRFEIVVASSGDGLQ